MGIIASRKDSFDVQNLEEEVRRVAMPVVIDFFATWCGPCKMLSPVLASVEERYDGEVRFVKVDIDEHPDVANRYEVMSVPTLLFFYGGKLVRRESGFMSENEISSIIEKDLLNINSKI